MGSEKKMAAAQVELQSGEEISENKYEPFEEGEPTKKKVKTDDESAECQQKLEQRLNGILCCAVCLSLPKTSIYQCTNGHLMCAGCTTHLLADARLKDEQATCPNCRCEISKTLCSRNLAVENCCRELPAECIYCSRHLPRSFLERHQKFECEERLTKCQYHRIGCPWEGPYHELSQHEMECIHPQKPGRDIMGSLLHIDQKHAEEMKLYNNIFKLLSFEKIMFHDLQMRPYRTDDFITRLFYETSRFSSLNQQWVVKARVNDNQRDPNQSISRKLSYQLVLKSRINGGSTPGSLDLQYLVLKGPFGETSVNPVIYHHEFSNESYESPYQHLPVETSADCNKLLAAKTINFRLILFQVQK